MPDTPGPDRVFSRISAQLIFLFLAEVWFVVAALATWVARFAKRRAAC